MRWLCLLICITFASVSIPPTSADCMDWPLSADGICMEAFPRPHIEVLAGVTQTISPACVLGGVASGPCELFGQVSVVENDLAITHAVDVVDTRPGGLLMRIGSNLAALSYSPVTDYGWRSTWYTTPHEQVGTETCGSWNGGGGTGGEGHTCFIYHIWHNTCFDAVCYTNDAFRTDVFLYQDGTLIQETNTQMNQKVIWLNVDSAEKRAYTIKDLQGDNKYDTMDETHWVIDSPTADLLVPGDDAMHTLLITHPVSSQNSWDVLSTGGWPVFIQYDGRNQEWHVYEYRGN